jgi:hypothetical protein
VAELQINLVYEDKVVERWKYISKLDCWRDELELYDIPTNVMIKDDLTAAVEHFLSILKGTHV